MAVRKFETRFGSSICLVVLGQDCWPRHRRYGRRVVVSHCLAHVGLGGKHPDCLEHVCIAVYEQTLATVSDELACAALSHRYDGHAYAARFQGSDAERFEVGGRDEDIRTGQNRPDLVAGQCSGEIDTVVEPSAPYVSSDRAKLATVADQDSAEPDPVGQLCAKFSEHVDERALALASSEPTDRHHRERRVIRATVLAAPGKRVNPVGQDTDRHTITERTSPRCGRSIAHGGESDCPCRESRNGRGPSKAHGRIGNN